MLLFHSGSLSGGELVVQYGAVEGWRIQSGDWWRVLTAIFLHTSVFSYILGLFFLYVLGPQLEWLLGRLFFLIIYVFSGMLTYIIIYITDMEGIYFGSLGAVYGIFGVYLYLFVRKAIHPQFGLAILILTILNLIVDYPLTGVYFISVLAGFVLALLFLQFRRPDSES
jgi:rhomboid protease GluP